MCERIKESQISPDRITQLDKSVRNLGLDKDFELYYGNSREICENKNILRITIKGHDVEGEATQ
jgi:proline dehydrogenase